MFLKVFILLLPTVCLFLFVCLFFVLFLRNNIFEEKFISSSNSYSRGHVPLVFALRLPFLIFTFFLSVFRFLFLSFFLSLIFSIPMFKFTLPRHLLYFYLCVCLGFFGFGFYFLLSVDVFFLPPFCSFSNCLSDCLEDWNLK